jgi:hypothetical protein
MAGPVLRTRWQPPTSGISLEALAGIIGHKNVVHPANRAHAWAKDEPPHFDGPILVSDRDVVRTIAVQEQCPTARPHIFLCHERSIEQLIEMDEERALPIWPFFSPLFRKDLAELDGGRPEAPEPQLWCLFTSEADPEGRPWGASSWLEQEKRIEWLAASAGAKGALVRAPEAVVLQGHIEFLLARERGIISCRRGHWGPTAVEVRHGFSPFGGRRLLVWKDGHGLRLSWRGANEQSAETGVVLGLPLEGQGVEEHA